MISLGKLALLPGWGPGRGSDMDFGGFSGPNAYIVVIPASVAGRSEVFAHGARG